MAYGTNKKKPAAKKAAPNKMKGSPLRELLGVSDTSTGKGSPLRELLGVSNSKNKNGNSIKQRIKESVNTYNKMQAAKNAKSASKSKDNTMGTIRRNLVNTKTGKVTKGPLKTLKGKTISEKEFNK